MNPTVLFLLVAGMAGGCACTRSGSYAIADADTFEAETRRRAEAAAVAEPAALAEAPEAVRCEASPESIHAAAALAIEPGAAGLAPQGVVDTTSYVMLKGGYFGIETDAADLDEESGLIFNAAFGRYFSRLLAVELEVGYFQTDSSVGGADIDLYGIPIMLNGRISLPIWVLEAYGGLGVGGFYYDVEGTNLPIIGNAQDDGFLFGGNAFLGADIAIADTLTLGLEGKYYVSEEIDDVDESLDAVAVMLTLGFRH